MMDLEIYFFIICEDDVNDKIEEIETEIDIGREGERRDF